MTTEIKTAISWRPGSWHGFPGVDHEGRQDIAVHCQVCLSLLLINYLQTSRLTFIEFAIIVQLFERYRVLLWSGLRFKSWTSQTGHRVSNGSPPQQHFFEKRYDAEMGPANSLHASASYSEYNQRFDLISRASMQVLSPCSSCLRLLRCSSDTLCIKTTLRFTIGCCQASQGLGFSYFLKKCLQSSICGMGHISHWCIIIWSSYLLFSISRYVEPLMVVPMFQHAGVRKNSP